MRAVKIILATVAGLVGVACSSYDHTCFVDVADLPLKTDREPGQDWASSPLRSHAMYVLYGAESARERRDRIGDYYFVRWYDAEPTKPVRVLMRYTQAATGADELRVEHTMTQPREAAGTRTERFFFSGEERRKKGDILTWKMELHVDGKLVDTRQSFLWE
ncbi:MAG: hypothetical protein E7033_03560 [Akkermansiaceae bacterium]|nr:hypothetical protein [Akkermansiaceae bacterium]